MRTSTKVFAGAGAFGLVVGGIYWFVTYEDAGTVLLLSMGFAVLIVAGYLLRRARAPLPEDRADAGPADAGDEPVGTFILGSAWPAWLALASALVAAGLLFGVALVALGLALATVAVIGLIREGR